jgi:ribosomal-protein-alanine N-acetyltransferase
MKFPEIYSERIILRELSESDYSLLFEVYSNKKAMRYWDSETHNDESITLEMVHRMKNAWYKKQGVSWGIILRKSQKLIGQFSIHSWNIEEEKAKLDYIINPNYWSMGYGSEVLNLVVNFGLNELGLKNIIAEIDPNNIPSLTILEKYGFNLIKSIKNDLIINGVYHDTDVYKLDYSSL